MRLFFQRDCRGCLGPRNAKQRVRAKFRSRTVLHTPPAPMPHQRRERTRNIKNRFVGDRHAWHKRSDTVGAKDGQLP